MDSLLCNCNMQLAGQLMQTWQYVLTAIRIRVLKRLYYTCRTVGPEATVNETNINSKGDDLTRSKTANRIPKCVTAVTYLCMYTQTHTPNKSCIWLIVVSEDIAVSYTAQIKNIGHLFSFGSRNRGKQKAFRLSKRQICFPQGGSCLV